MNMIATICQIGIALLLIVLLCVAAKEIDKLENEIDKLKAHLKDLKWKLNLE